MTITSISHITSRCGGGKSFHTIIELHNHLLQNSGITGTHSKFYLVASKTNELSKQNYTRFSSEVRSQQSSVQHRLIDSTESKSVANDIANHLRFNKQGVLFISHAAVVMLDPRELTDTVLIYDEVPSNLVFTLKLQYEEKDQGHSWEKFISRTPIDNNSYQKVTLSQNIDRSEITRFIENIQTRRDNTSTSNVAQILGFLLDGHEDLYFQTRNHESKSYGYYFGVDWKPLKELQRHASQVVVLSAEFRKTLLGFVAENVAGLKIDEANIKSDITLETKHKKYVTIYPIITGSTWSTYLKNKRAQEALESLALAIDPNDTVYEHSLKVISAKLSPQSYLLIQNKKDDQSKHDSIKVISSSSHGSNSYTDYHHAAYLASNRPDPIEKFCLKLFAEKHGVSLKDLLSCVITERCHESAYQGLARTSIRDARSNFTGEHIFFVPDIEYANYVFNWFEQGYATIDTSLASTMLPTKAKQTRKQTELAILVHILSENQTNKTPIKVLVAQSAISMATYNRYRSKHKQELQKLGLIP